METRGSNSDSVTPEGRSKLIRVELGHESLHPIVVALSPQSCRIQIRMVSCAAPEPNVMFPDRHRDQESDLIPEFFESLDRRPCPVPRVPRGNTTLPTIMVAEKAAALIKEDPQSP